MKKLLLISIAILLSVPLFAKITIPETIPEEYREVLLMSLSENLDGRGSDAAVESFSLDDETGTATFCLLLEDKRLTSTIPVEMLGVEIHNMLFYEELLYMEGEILDFIQQSSFSFLPDGKYREGETLRLRDKNGTTRGLFSVDKVYEDGVILRPHYLKQPFPGMALEKELPLKVSVNLGASLDFQKFSLETKVAYSALIYPVSPTLSLAVDLGEEALLDVGVGIQMDFSLGSLFPDSAAILRNTSLVGSAELLLGTGLQGRFTVGAENMVTSHLSYGAVFICYGLSRFGVSLTGGYAL